MRVRARARAAQGRAREFYRKNLFSCFHSCANPRGITVTSGYKAF